MEVLTPDQLVDRAALHDLVAAYADAVNRRAADELADLFVEDGEWLVPGVGTTRGRQDIAALLRNLVGGFEVLVQTVHQGRVTVDGDHATGRFYLSETGIDANGTPVHFVGVYHDLMVRTDEGWRFSRRKFDFLYRQVGQEKFRGYPFPD